jgi:hypothetical protein
MIRNFIARFALVLGSIHGSLALFGCSEDPAPAPEPEQTAAGSLSLPLLAQAGGHTYRLQGSMYVSGPSFTYLDLGTDAEVVTTTLPTGSYYGYLYWWTLLRDDGSGNFQPVQATLLSSVSPSFSIFNQTTSTISFEFETDGQIVKVGSGSLRVEVAVSEKAPICTPLGDGCPDGTWCAPSELTGAPLACVAEGAVALGEKCSSPLDCVAGASCFDFGAGPICARLCSSADFEQPCDEGGTCTAQGAEYGVCVPTP